jgi:4-hydroxybenzoate polyprenyltransferase
MRAVNRDRKIGLAITIGGGVLFVLSWVVGLAWTAYGMMLSTTSDEAVDPSQKARVLAEGISSAANGAIFGAVSSVVGVLVAGIGLVVFVRAKQTDKR